DTWAHKSPLISLTDRGHLRCEIQRSFRELLLTCVQSRQDRMAVLVACNNDSIPAIVCRGGPVSVEGVMDPIQRFSLWFRAAVERSPGSWFDPSAMTLATCGRNGDVTARMVLLKNPRPISIRVRGRPNWQRPHRCNPQ